MSIHLMKQKADPSFRDALHLAPMPDSYDLDRGLLLAVQAIQVRFVGNVGNQDEKLFEHYQFGTLSL